MNHCARPWPKRRKTSPRSPKNRCAKTGRRKTRTARRVGEKFDPFQRVGVYIPGGKAPLVSTALMTITLAKAAGCPEIVVCTPCGRDGGINPALLFATRAAGATEIYRVGGAQAIAAMAYGTQTIRRVQKIFGPGNAYVVTAKRLLVGHVAIDLLPGPSELLVLADDTANPEIRRRRHAGAGRARLRPRARLAGDDFGQDFESRRKGNRAATAEDWRGANISSARCTTTAG